MGLITSLLIAAGAAIAGSKVKEAMEDKNETQKELARIQHESKKELTNIKHSNEKDLMYAKHMQDKDMRILEHNLANNKEIPTLKHCTHCGASNEQEARFCYKCGHEINFNPIKVSKYCSSCGHALIGEKGFTVKCEYCGNEQIL